MSVVYAVTLVLGLCIGSFLNVIIFRTHKATSPWRGRSKCMQCGQKIHWYDNIPLLSFVWLRGKCRSCSKSLSWQYPLVEVGTAIFFLLVTWRFGFTWWAVGAWVVTSVMIAIAVYDARWSLLPDSFSIALAIAGCVFALLSGVPPVTLVLGAVAGAGFFGAQYLASRGRWVGSGDILLGGALGILLGWRMLGLSLFLAYLIGAAVASVLLLLRRQKGNSAMAFGPYLVLGGFIAWLWGEQLVNWYFNHALFN